MNHFELTQDGRWRYITSDDPWRELEAVVKRLENPNLRLPGETTSDLFKRAGALRNRLQVNGIMDLMRRGPLAFNRSKDLRTGTTIS